MTAADKPKPIGAETMLWWSSLSVQWKKNMADEWGVMQANLMEKFIEEYERKMGLH